jgi:hypothetical protein
MPSLVRRDDVEASGKTESDAANERIWEVNTREIEIAVRTQERVHVGLRRDKAGECVSERRCLARPNLSRGPKP